MLFIIRIEATTLSLGVVTTGAGDIVGAIRAGALPMVSIATLTICTIKVGSTYRAKVPIGAAGRGAIVCSCQAILFVCNAPTCLEIVSS